MGQRRPRTGSDNRIKCRTGEPSSPQAGLDGLRDVLLPLARRQVGQHSQGHRRNATPRFAQPFDLPRVFDHAAGLDDVHRRDDPIGAATRAAASAAVSHR